MPKPSLLNSCDTSKGAYEFHAFSTGIISKENVIA